MFSYEMSGKRVVSDFGRRAGGWMRGFFEADFAAISTLMVISFCIFFQCTGFSVSRRGDRFLGNLVFRETFLTNTGVRSTY